MAVEIDPYKLSSPRIYLVRMVVFLILVGFVALILNEQIAKDFKGNPALNSLIFFVLFVGIVLALRQVIRLFREVRWVNALPRGLENEVTQPVLLAPIATLFAGRPVNEVTLPTLTLRAILDSIGTRLDEARDTSRYLTGLLIFLGLLGTFWGLLTTVGSIGNIINSLQTGGDAAVMFDDLKNGLARPLAGMSISFTSSLFGLAGSLVLGFLDLQAGQAQNRFYNELEENLTARTAAEIAGRDRPRRRRHAAGCARRARQDRRDRRPDACAGDVDCHRQSRRRRPEPRAAYARRAADDPRLGRGPGRAEPRNEGRAETARQRETEPR